MPMRTDAGRQLTEAEMSLHHMIAKGRDLDRSWMGRGNCAGMNPDLFFPARGEASAPAKAVCAPCEVKERCLNYAIEGGERFGVWGGMSERERRRVRRGRQEENKHGRAPFMWGCPCVKCGDAKVVYMRGVA